MGGIDLVVTDLDGTLWDHNVEVHASARSALDVLANAGVPVVAATGRRKVSTLRGFETAGLTFPAITVNGAYGFIPSVEDAGEREFHRHPFDVETGLAVLEIYRSFGQVPVAYNIDGTAHLSPHSTTSQRHAKTFGADAIRANPEEAVRLGEVVGFGVIGVETAGGLGELGAALEAVGVQTDPYQERTYGGWSMTAQPPGVTKWLGVERYCEFAGLDRPTVLALGDGNNDVELLEGADISLGIEGGDPDALAHADRIIAPPEEGGWQAVLDYL